MELTPDSVRAIAFYLPQFHPIPENDSWWGAGFTEWRNVANARPQIKGHYQPHVPADLGYYDLRLPETRTAQADLARYYGIHGFCYYHYWFNGRRILERPFEEVLEDGEPDFPFCLCWANENWTRRWDGGDKEILLQQSYSAEDDRAHIESLIPAFRDPRYIRVNGKPVFLVYQTALLPNPAETASMWRKIVREAGLEGLFLIHVENVTAASWQKPILDPRQIGFDAAVRFAPDTRVLGRALWNGRKYAPVRWLRMVESGYGVHMVHSYENLVERTIRSETVEYPRYPCVAPSWDNTARRKQGATIYLGSDPAIYGRWISYAVNHVKQNFAGDERLLFINAWNEWAEGCHLEPDIAFGHGYLEETKNALAE